MNNLFKKGLFGSKLGNVVYSDPSSGPTRNLGPTCSLSREAQGLGGLGWRCREVGYPVRVGPGNQVALMRWGWMGLRAGDLETHLGPLRGRKRTILRCFCCGPSAHMASLLVGAVQWVRLNWSWGGSGLPSGWLLIRADLWFGVAPLWCLDPVSSLPEAGEPFQQPSLS